MAKKESGFKVIVIMVIIAMFSAVLLAYVNTVTRGPIEENKKAEVKRAIKYVLKGVDISAVPEVALNLTIDNSPVSYFVAPGDSGKPAGAAFIVKGPNGFSGDFDIMVGIGGDGNIIDTYVLAHKETPGLGDNMTKEAFQKQFRGKNLANTKWMVKKDGGDIDALTAATISSRAFTHGVKRALMAFDKLAEEN